MGGVHALMAAACCPQPLAVAAFMTPRCASSVFCSGALADACDWETLARTTPPPSARRRPLWEEPPEGDGSQGGGSQEEGGGRKLMQSPVLGWGEGGGGGGQDVRAELARVLAFTDISLLPPPPTPHATILLVASEDAYVDPHSSTSLRESWGAQGSAAEVRWLSGGHVNAFFTGQEAMREALRDAMARLHTAPADPHPSKDTEGGCSAAHAHSLPLHPEEDTEGGARISRGGGLPRA
ncbi:hypothetical protein T484DRAFT_1909499 [Baffinella frigidus]|nr:hypothetical protein T484DRAFT_1909499 [Cryptophyta sp. CCMP2293]